MSATLLNLPEANVPSDNDVVYVVQNGESKKITISGLASAPIFAQKPPLIIPFNLGGTSFSIGVSTSLFGNSASAAVRHVNLFGYTGCNFNYVKGSTLGTSTSGQIWLGCSTTYSTSVAAYTGINLMTPRNHLPIDFTNRYVDSGTFSLSAEATLSTSGVFIAILGSGGDGTSLGMGPIQAIFT